MKFKYEKEFREAHPETIGEKDSAFDLCNYTEWLETKVSRVELPVMQKIAEEVEDWLQKNDCGYHSNYYCIDEELIPELKKKIESKISA